MLLALLFISEACLIQDSIFDEPRRPIFTLNWTKTGFRCAVAGNLLEVFKVPR